MSEDIRLPDDNIFFYSVPKVLKSVRNTSSLISHLKMRHEVTEATRNRDPSSRSNRSKQSPHPPSLPEEEEPPPVVGGSGVGSLQKKRKQSTIDPFVVKKHTLRSEMLRLICESNVSLHQIVTSGTLRRLLTQNYPNEPPPPASTNTVKRILIGEALKVQDRLAKTLTPILKKGEFRLWNRLRGNESL